MARSILRSLTPDSFYGRAALILIVPILVIQIVLSVVFIQRHYERTTAQMTLNAARSLHLVLDRIDASAAVQDALTDLSGLIAQIDIALDLRPALPAQIAPARWHDLAGTQILRSLRAEFPQFRLGELGRDDGLVALWFETRHGLLQVLVPRRLLTTSNPHQLLVIVFVASLVMTLIAFQFLRLQIRPIRRLEAAAEAYGRGERLPVRASGAREIRAAARAFIDMRNRIERARGQQQIMLSGVSHDMRTPLTRMRLILSMMDEDEDRTALELEIADLERRLEQFLDFTRGQIQEEPVVTDPDALIRDLAQRYRAAGHEVTLDLPAPAPGLRWLRAQALGRALDNLLSNALHYGSSVRVARVSTQEGVRIVVDDDGPGIPPDQRDAACEPFQRLDAGRNADAGRVGLGLAIVADAAAAQGGSFRLEDSPTMGGLRAVLDLPARAASYSR